MFVFLYNCSIFLLLLLDFIRHNISRWLPIRICRVSRGLNWVFFILICLNLDFFFIFCRSKRGTLIFFYFWIVLIYFHKEFKILSSITFLTHTLIKVIFLLTFLKLTCLSLTITYYLQLWHSHTASLWIRRVWMIIWANRIGNTHLLFEFVVLSFGMWFLRKLKAPSLKQDWMSQLWFVWNMRERIVNVVRCIWIPLLNIRLRNIWWHHLVMIYNLPVAVLLVTSRQFF